MLFSINITRFFYFCVMWRSQSSSTEDGVNTKGRCAINTSSPSDHSSYILSRKNLGDMEKDNLSPSLMRDTNGHIHNIQHRETSSNTNTDRLIFPGIKSNTTTMNKMTLMPSLHLRKNISASKITMSSCKTG